MSSSPSPSPSSPLSPLSPAPVAAGRSPWLILAVLCTSVFIIVVDGTIVNVAHVAATTRDLTGRVLLRMKSRPETVPVSRAYGHLFKQM